MNPIQKAISNIAWKRTFIVCAALGGLSTLGGQKDIENGGQAIGYFIGATSAWVVMAGTATAACSKQDSMVLP